MWLGGDRALRHDERPIPRALDRAHDPRWRIERVIDRGSIRHEPASLDPARGANESLEGVLVDLEAFGSLAIVGEKSCVTNTRQWRGMRKKFVSAWNRRL